MALTKTTKSSDEIFALYKELGSLEAVGTVLDLTRERVRQIINKDNRKQYHEYHEAKVDKIHAGVLTRSLRKCVTCGKAFFHKQKILNCSPECLRQHWINLQLAKQTTGVRECSCCHITQPLSGFYPDYSRSKDMGIKIYARKCRSCHSKVSKAWADRNRPYINLRNKAYAARRKLLTGK